MITVIVYGRNDYHGYNYQKRCAISLNCIAEILSDKDDEIIFADYNSAEDYPTLVEAINDTLTERCRRLLTVLRIRADTHRRFQDLTHLEVVETVSRNAAIRRSNPANRWVLSTNTDMVFTPRQAGRSLSDIVAELPDGFYQMPRFELPETLWETLDRTAPQRTIATIGEYGTRLHINEVVHTDPQARFDGIGDFQLILRRDLFAIHGFNEKMLLGWNVDMNMCRRLGLIYGPPGTIIDDLFVYHLDHTRKATIALSADPIQNDPVTFIERVSKPDLPEQAADWGLNGCTLETFRADRTPAQRCRDAFFAALPENASPYVEAWNQPQHYFSVRYPAEHALCYAADHLSTLSPETVIGYIGGSRAMLRQILAVWQHFGGSKSLLVPETLAEIIPPDLAGIVETATFDRIQAEAGIFIVEFAVDADEYPDLSLRRLSDLPASLLHRLGLILATFVRLCALERDTLHRDHKQKPGRKFICVHSVNTYFGDVVNDELLTTMTAYSTRVRYGYVRPQLRTHRIPVERHDGLPAFLRQRLRRTFYVSGSELGLIQGDLQRLLKAPSPVDVDPRCFTECLAVLLEWPGLPAVTGATQERLATLRGEVYQRLPRHRIAPQVTVPIASPPIPPEPALNKLIAAEDWENPDWLSWADRFAHSGWPSPFSTYTYFHRSRGVWERVQMIYALDRLGVLGPQATAAVLLSGPDGLPLFLSSRVGKVDVISLDGSDPASLLLKKRWFDPACVYPYPGGLENQALEHRQWDVVIIPQNGLLTVDNEAGRATLFQRLAWVERHLAAGGIAVWSAEIILNNQCAPGALLPEALMRLEDEMIAKTRLQPTGPMDWTLTPATMDRIAVTGTSDITKPHFLRRTGAAIHGPVVRLWHKDEETKHRT